MLQTQTLCHGDAHMGNFYVQPEHDGVGAIDFQCLCQVSNAYAS